MKKIIFCFLLAISVLQTSTAQSEAVKSFDFQGLKFGSDIDTFKKRFPDATINEAQSDSRNGIEAFVIRNHNDIDAVMCYFFENSLFYITLAYSPATLQRMGGWISVHDRLVEKYGQGGGGVLPNSNQNYAVYTWGGPPDSDFAITFEVSLTKTLKVDFIDGYILQKVDKKKKERANVGF